MRSRSIVFPLQLAAACLFALTTFSQTRDKVRFGKVDPEDFAATSFEKDTSAHAVVIADIGSSEFQVERDHFELTYKRFKRIKVVDKNGYDAASEEIPLYISGQLEEKLINLKAVAYNLENGKVVETKMESKSVFTDKYDKNHILKKFTVPGVKEGTIIEYTYSVTSPFYFNLQPWNFQNEYPTLQSEYSVTIPEIYDFVFLKQDINSMLTVKTTVDRQTYNVTYESNGPTGASQHGSFSANTVKNVWTAKDIPALREESYTTSLRNHITRIEFQLSAIKYPESPIKPILGNWQKFSEDLNKDENFGADLSKNNGYLGDVVDQLTNGLKDDTAKARRIYNYVRNNFTCTDHSSLYLTKPLKTVFSSHNGSEADINLLLIAMLRRAKLHADPVVLSTRNHGFTHELYPLKSRFNYTMAAVTVDTLTYFLDASRPYLGFGRVDMSCYNGHARMLTAESVPVYFNPDDLLEQKSTFVMLMGGEGGILKGSLQQYPTYFESCAMRSSIKDKGKDAYFKGKEKDFVAETVISGVELENLDDNEEVLKLKYDFDMKADDAGMIYINPLFTEAMRKNPFRSQERRYPVEMPCVMDETYTLNLTVPDGYVVEEIPKSAMVKFNENEGVFQYLIQQSENSIQFRSRIKLNRAVFAADEYNSLRDFFDMIVKKQSEQIVLKRKS
ncbi:DUF3858 domain-containing protein [Chitinophaga filiformis]|uniref:Transglutaminase-like superfamily protein n=1 Tax=Chitinophaga filiformis TaxID=104663 RepID=A0A1G8DBH7_CHIFI|nr:DUF3858 domain-containing protein [Chitinophaga filiformis]SDH55045.1 Transglutaminase-like superfamily protein [Chitinophaga filiformis]